MYIGSSKIASENILPSGLIEVTVLEPQGVPPISLFTVDQLEAVKSETPYSDGDISARKWKLTVAKVIEQFVHDNMELVDRSYVIGRIDEAIKTMYGKAVAQKFEVDNLERISLQTLFDLVQSK